MRFAGMVTDLDGIAHRWAAPADPADCSLVAETGIADRIIAHASYDRVGSDSAEVAFVVADDSQGRGIAMLLLEELAERAQEAGISTFCADVLAENARMLRGLPRERIPDPLACRAGSGPCRVPDRPHRPGSRTLRAPRADRGGRRGARPALPGRPSP